MVCIQVIANDSAIAFASTQGNFELNVYKPLMIYNFLQSATLLKDSCHNFKIFCIDGLEVNEKQLQFYVENSLMLVTALNPIIGYDKAAKIAHTAFVENTSLKQAAVKLGFLTAEEFDKAVRPEEMTHP